MRRWRDVSGSRNRSHRKRCTSKASRKAEHCGRAWVRELVKMAQESRTSKCIGNPTRDSQDPGVVCNIAREFCDCSGLSADSNAEAFEVDRLLTEFTNLPFSEGHRAWKGDKLLASVLFFFPTFSQLEGARLARSFRALKGWNKASPSFSRRPLPVAVWSALAVEMCRIGGTLAAVLTLVMLEGPGENAVLRVSWHRRRVESEAG